MARRRRSSTACRVSSGPHAARVILQFIFEADRITEVDAIANPDDMRHVDLVVA
jgi:hypothetical protein